MGVGNSAGTICSIMFAEVVIATFQLSEVPDGSGNVDKGTVYA